MVVEVVEARPLEVLKLRLRFSDGKEGVVDLSALELPGLLSRLRDPGFFAQVRVDPELGAPVWPGGLDLDPLVLYAQALGTGLPLPAEASGA
ncbi:DUF2442 domain-containing protein [Thermus scotoductus]|jgi:hypothetical protein|uniref:DUF2442 domain-containing protein n=3 Tax=Thermus TaxID=270 RepID=A0A430REL9_THESC|nr:MULTISPECIES: DUF2442 domain-containing protein [Thermus]AGK85229.1 hypothetical protein WG13_10 [Thermus sp. WG]RTH05920.1 DUF2442 domain-containing protein [Thermus scotoductus]RTH19986.1 DUF2442 domain-containing protein [Thermus scotoductus]RTH32606.1 DUF2442 domain-containing protein [Thermus scotoductus]RTH97047.1 DUF2442 domain-containing protein [Thermus scotoductus]